MQKEKKNIFQTFFKPFREIKSEMTKKRVFVSILNY